MIGLRIQIKKKKTARQQQSEQKNHSLSKLSPNFEPYCSASHQVLQLSNIHIHSRVVPYSISASFMTKSGQTLGMDG